MGEQSDELRPAIVVERRLRKLVRVEIEIECLVRVSCPTLLHNNVALAVEDGQQHLLVCFTTGFR
jgi:hypothetical protein